MTVLASPPERVPAPAATLRLLPQRCKLCGTVHDPAPIAICEQCLGPLEPAYDAARPLPSRVEIETRAPSLWRYAEWLPFEGAPVHSLDTGCTPLLEAPRLARRLGVARAWVKNEAVSHPSLSFKDRVVATAINAAHAFGLDTIGCASTGNLANAVAAQAARAGLRAWIFIPHDLEVGKVTGTAIYGPRLVRVKGNYDDVNRLCQQVADKYGWGLVNINLRGYYGDGSKTVAYEIAEQLGWRVPTAVVAPMAGGSLLSKIAKGFTDFLDAKLVHGTAPRLYGVQATGCQPIVNLFQSGGDRVTPVVPDTIARSIAIGNPADGTFAVQAIRRTGGVAVGVSDDALVQGIRALAEDTGVFTETAGGVTVAGALALAAEGKLGPNDEVVLCITSNGLKTVEAVTDRLPQAPIVAARLKEVAALVEGGY